MRFQASVLVGLSTTCLLSDRIAAQQSGRPVERQRVVGIGGVFFRSREPNTLSAWYATHLGIPTAPQSYDAEPWNPEGGPTVLAPFADTTQKFGRPSQQWMINFRVRDLDAMVRQLRAAGIRVDVDPQDYPNGRFAELRDPEGNPIELWEPRLPSNRRKP